MNLIESLTLFLSRINYAETRRRTAIIDLEELVSGHAEDLDHAAGISADTSDLVAGMLDIDGQRTLEWLQERNREIDDRCQATGLKGFVTAVETMGRALNDLSGRFSADVDDTSQDPELSSTPDGDGSLFRGAAYTILQTDLSDSRKDVERLKGSLAEARLDMKRKDIEIHLQDQEIDKSNAERDKLSVDLALVSETLRIAGEEHASLINACSDQAGQHSKDLNEMNEEWGNEIKANNSLRARNGELGTEVLKLLDMVKELASKLNHATRPRKRTYSTSTRPNRTRQGFIHREWLYLGRPALKYGEQHGLVIVKIKLPLADVLQRGVWLTESEYLDFKGGAPSRKNKQ